MYVHTQRGRALALLAISACIVMLVVLLTQAPQLALGPRLTMAAAVVVLLLTSVVFATLTIQVGDGRLTWYFGPRVFLKSVPLSEIASAETTRTTWLEGWGIHWTFRGWHYNVAGTQAVHFTMRDGKQFMLGTDEPDALVRAIGSAR